jgi:hypothetical protein
VRLERLTLLNTSFGPPADPASSLRPPWLDTSRAASLEFVDVIAFTSGGGVAAYAAHLNAVAAADAALRFYTVRGSKAAPGVRARCLRPRCLRGPPLSCRRRAPPCCSARLHPGLTLPAPPLPRRPAHAQDNRTFVHINAWVSPSGVRATSVGLLQVGAGDEQLPQPFAPSPPSPPAPVVLAVTNTTLVPALRRHAGVPTPVPLLVYVGGNATLAGGTIAGGGGAAAARRGAPSPAPAPPWALAPFENITVARPVILVGRANDPTGIDFSMRVNQLVAAGPHARLTLDSLRLENLGFGDEAAAPTAADVNLKTTFGFWAFNYQRREQRLVIRNCTAVIPASEADYIL